MKVLYLAPERTRADRLTAMTFIDEELIALAARGVEAHVLSVAAARDEVIDGVRIRPVPSGRPPEAIVRNLWYGAARQPFPGFPASRQQLRGIYSALRVEREARRLVERESFDMIHTHFGSPGGWGGLAVGRRAGRPVIASFRGMDLLSSPELAYGLRLDSLYDRNVRRLLRDAARTLYVSDYMRTRGIELGAPAARAFTIRKGVDTTRFRPGAAPQAEPPEILVACNLLPRKRVDHLLRAVAPLARMLDFRVSICGVGPEETRLRALSAALGIAERTRFHGWVERARIPELFARATVFVLPSVEEASGNVLLEAQASGTPTICMASGGAPEYVRDGVTGFVVAADAGHDLTDRIRRLLQDPELRREMAHAARAFATQELTYDCMIEGILQSYRDVLQERADRESAARRPEMPAADRGHHAVT